MRQRAAAPIEATFFCAVSDEPALGPGAQWVKMRPGSWRQQQHLTGKDHNELSH